MKTVQQLRAVGFVVQAAAEGVDCTDVRSTRPFWYFNGRFYEQLEEILANLEPARVLAPGQYCLTVAGAFQDDDTFPFVLVDENTKALLDHANACRKRSQLAFKEAEETFQEARKLFR